MFNNLMSSCLFLIAKLIIFFFFLLLQIIFIYVEIDNEDVGKPVAEYFGVSGDGPNVSLSSAFSLSFPFLSADSE